MAGGNGRVSIDKVVRRKIHIFSIIQQPMIVISLKFVEIFDLDCVALGQVPWLAGDKKFQTPISEMLPQLLDGRL